MQPKPTSQNFKRTSQLGIGLVLGLVLVGVFLWLQVLHDQPSIVELQRMIVFSGVILVSFIVIFTALLYRNYQYTLQNETTLHIMLADYDRRRTQLQVAARIARDAAAQPILQEVLQSAVQLVHDRFGFYHAGIFLIDSTREYAVLRAVAGGAASQSLLERQHRLKVGQQGIIGYVTSAGLPRIASNVSLDRHYYDNPALPATRSEMAVPLKVGAHIIGALDVQSVKENAFDSQDIEIMQAMADLLAIAIQRTTLLEEIQTNAALLEQRVQTRTQELASERAQLNAILESMQEGVLYRENNETVYMNSAFRKLVGYHASDTWIDDVDQLFSASPQEARAIYDEIARGLVQQGEWHGEVKILRRDNTDFDASLTSRIVSRVGATLGTLTIIRDISQEKALQEQKIRFVSYASHELRTPLTNLKTRLFLIQRQPQRVEEHIGVISQVVERMQRLVNDLLDKSRFERGRISLERKIAVLQEIVQDVILTQLPEAEAKHQLLTHRVTEQPLLVLIDIDRMTQVITNLLTNAINYTPENGKIHVAVYELDQQRVEIMVEDNGVGIPAEILPRLFQPFVRADNVSTKGTGLGLNITRQIVELHGGEISVESATGQGSRFYVRLNLVQKPSPTPAV
jgi:PAS domain S-box-containing protein